MTSIFEINKDVFLFREQRMGQFTLLTLVKYIQLMTKPVKSFSNILIKTFLLTTILIFLQTMD